MVMFTVLMPIYSSRKEIKIKVFFPIAYCLLITVSQSLICHFCLSFRVTSPACQQLLPSLLWRSRTPGQLGCRGTYSSMAAVSLSILLCITIS